MSSINDILKHDSPFTTYTLAQIAHTLWKAQIDPKNDDPPHMIIDEFIKQNEKSLIDDQAMIRESWRIEVSRNWIRIVRSKIEQTPLNIPPLPTDFFKHKRGRKVGTKNGAGKKRDSSLSEIFSDSDESSVSGTPPMTSLMKRIRTTCTQRDEVIVELENLDQTNREFTKKIKVIDEILATNQKMKEELIAQNKPFLEIREAKLVEKKELDTAIENAVEQGNSQTEQWNQLLRETNATSRQ